MVNPIETLKTNIDQAIYGYDPTEFMPIKVDGEVANWDAFAAYKARKVAEHVGHGVMRTAMATAHLASAVLENMQATPQQS